MDELVAAAADWVDEVHPHARHLHRTLGWLLKLDPEASVALQVAALTHDIERAFPGVEQPPSHDDPASPEYNAWHQRRAAEMVEAWLERRKAPPALVDDVAALVRVHEQGGWPEADLLQAADSLSFLEVQTKLFAGRVARGQLSAQSAERKLQFMYERVRLPRARELAGPLMQTAAATLAAVVSSPCSHTVNPTASNRKAEMRAYVLESFDAPPQMTDLPKPQPSAGEVLVRVHAVTVNPVDRAIASGGAKDWLEYQFPVTIGRDLAGTVEQVGSGVSRFAEGDRVFGYIAEPSAHKGSFAEYVVVPEDEFIVAQPDGLEHTEAAALGLAAVTATMCLDAVDARPGTELLVNGATGGVGSYAVQIAKARGSYVIASARPGDEERHVRSLGADESVDWSEGRLRDVVVAAHPEGLGGLVDVVTGDPEQFAALANAVLRPGGKVATTLNAADPERLNGIEGVNVWSAPETKRLQLISELAGAGKVRAPISEVFEFGRLEDAFEAVARGAIGKVAVRLV